jgi:hypothetical protein
MAGTTGLEPATSDVTGRRSNQLSYVPAFTSDNTLSVTRNVTQVKRAAPRDSDCPAAVDYRLP